MRRTNYKLYVIFLVIIVFMLGVVSIVYATLQTNLNIGFKSVTQSGINFDVGFDTTAVAGVSTNGATCPTITPTYKEITISGIQLGAHHSGGCTYHFVIKNKGNVKVKAASLKLTDASGITCTNKSNNNHMVCNHIGYQFNSAATGGVGYAVGREIAAGSSDNIYVQIFANDVNYANQAEGEITQSGAKFTITYQMVE